MLPEREASLLTGYLDGELSPRQLRAVARLLRRSAEARALLARLEEDSRALKAVAVPPLGVDLAPGVLQAIAARGLKPGQARPWPDATPEPARPTLAWPAWGSYAAAAAILLAVGLASYLFSSLGGAERGLPERPSIAQGGSQEKPGSSGSRAPEDGGTQVAREPRQQSEGPEAIPIMPSERLPAPPEPVVRVEVEDEEPLPERPPQEKKPEMPVLADGGREGFEKYERVELALPTLVKLSDLETTPGREPVLRELIKGGAFRIELPCRDAARAVDRLRPGLQGAGLPLLVDGTAATWVKKPTRKTNFALVFENVTPKALADILTKAAAEDRKAAARKPADARFDGSAVVSALSRWDRRELADLLGVDLAAGRPAARVPGPLQVDPSRPLSEQTEALVADVLDGKGPARPQSAAPGNALLVGMGLARPRLASPEVKRFLDARRPAAPGSVQVFLVLRNVGG